MTHVSAASVSEAYHPRMPDLLVVLRTRLDNAIKAYFPQIRSFQSS